MTRIKEILKADARYKEAYAEVEKISSIEDDEEREKAIQKATRLIVAVAYDRAEVYDLVGFMLILAADTLFRESAIMLDTVKDNVKFNDKFKLNEAKRALNKIISTFETESQKIHADYHLHAKVEDSDLTPYDAIEQNAKVILRFVLLLYNALKKSKGNAQILERSLRKLKGEGEEIFSIHEINSL